MASECPICILPIEKAIECPACQHEACVECVQTCITTSKKTECINCHVPFAYTFMYSVFPSKFVDEYVINPKVDEVYKEQCALITVEMPLKSLLQQLDRLIEITKFDVSHLITQVIDGIKSIRAELHRDVSSTTKYKCSGCKSGSYTIENPRCQLCEKLNCVSCETVVNGDLETHQCTKSDLDTLAEIKKESKRCPKCSIWISKIEGCNDMFCTECRTPFNYRTGEIIKRKGFHNPHYIEHLNRGGQQIPDDIDQDGEDIVVQPIDFRNRYLLETGERERIEELHVKITKMRRDLYSITSELLDAPLKWQTMREIAIRDGKDSTWVRSEVEYGYRRDIYHDELRAFNIKSVSKVVGILNDITHMIIDPVDGLRDIDMYINTYVNPVYKQMDSIRAFPKRLRLD
jgi:hypothetical protein